MRGFDTLIVFFAGVIVGALGYAYMGGERKGDFMPSEKQHILLERIQKVAKLITVEGDFSDVHTYEDPGWGGLSMFSKKAIIRVKAKVSVGFDLQKAQFVADEATKTITAKNLPQPEVLSIDHNLEFFNLSAGMFNSFSETDLTMISDSAKSLLREAAEKGPLFGQARGEGEQALEVIKMIVELSGWNFKIEYAPLPDSLRLDSLHLPGVQDKKKPDINN